MFDVVDDPVGAATGVIVEKVGYVTGWTGGTIHSTCVDFTPTYNKVVRCTYRAAYGRGNGDSGGPVFIRYANADSGEVALIGIHSGTDWDGVALFTKLERIKSDIGGSWVVKAHEATPLPPQPLSVQLRDQRTSKPARTAIFNIPRT